MASSLSECGTYAAVVSIGGEATKLEWVVDSEFRFFPTMKDEIFGYVLHTADLDVVDLLTIDDHILPLGAVIWAAAGKALGFTPEGIINEIRRMARYTEADFSRLNSESPLDPVATMKRFREVLAEAQVVQPDPNRLDAYRTHAGQRRGHWPSNAEITAEMFERAARAPISTT